MTPSRRAASVCAVFAFIMLAVNAPAAADDTTVTVDVDSNVGQVNPNLAGATWNTGELSHLDPFVPSYVRTGARFDDISAGPGQVDMTDILNRLHVIVDQGSTPLVLLNHMPEWLARPVPEGCQQQRRGQADCLRTSMGPTDLDEWQELVTEVVRSIVEEVPEATRFEIWNEPNNPKSWADTPDRFIETALAMERAVAAVERELHVDLIAGGPAIGDVTPLIREFVDAAKKQGTPPDFVSWHLYTREPLEYEQQFAAIQKLLGTKDLPIYLTEWNLYGQKGSDRATQVGAAFALAALTEFERIGVDRASFYRASSNNEEDGNAGLVTVSGKRHPSWWSLLLWKTLRGDRLQVDGDDPRDGLWARATRSGDRLDVILSNYSSAGAPQREVNVELRGACKTKAATVHEMLEGDVAFDDGAERDLNSMSISLPGTGAAWIAIDCSGRGDVTTLPKSAGVEADTTPWWKQPVALIGAAIVALIVAIGGAKTRRGPATGTPRERRARRRET